MATSGDLQTFFDEYRATFASFDLAALAKLFAFPLHVVSATGGEPSISVSDEAGWPGVLEALFGAYQALGVVDADPLAFEVAEVAGDVGSVHVHWQLRRDDGSPVYDFTAIYTVVLLEGGYRVSAIAHDELPKLAAAMSAASGN